MEARRCAECGKEFIPNSGRQRVCSPECRRRRRVRQGQRYYEEHMEDIRARRRRHYREHGESAREYQRAHYQSRGAKPKACPFTGTCFECPYPDCVY